MSNEPEIFQDSTPDLDTAMQIIKSFLEHMEYTLGKDKYTALRRDVYNALSYSVRDKLISRFAATRRPGEAKRSAHRAGSAVSGMPQPGKPPVFLALPELRHSPRSAAWPL